VTKQREEEKEKEKEKNKKNKKKGNERSDDGRGCVANLASRVDRK
jgi:hypothetical protein